MANLIVDNGPFLCKHFVEFDFSALRHEIIVAYVVGESNQSVELIFVICRDQLSVSMARDSFAALNS